MRSSGFSLVELVVIMAIIGILMSIGAINFSSWQRKGIVERTVKELHADLQNARTEAVYTKTRRAVDVSPQQVTFRSFSSEADAAGKILSVRKLPVTVTLSSWTLPTANRVMFSTSGIMSDPEVKVLCFSTSVDAAYDALIITPALTAMGKVVDRGAGCANSNVIQK